MSLTAERLRELLNYEPDTGVFRWRANAGRYGRIPAGTAAGSKNTVHGYSEITIAGTRYKAHRLAWLYVHGAWPADEIDHRNRIRSDNRLSNLRECTTAENLQNKNVYKSNTSGCPGVNWHKASGKWVARIGLDGRRRSIGYYVSKDDATAAYVEAKARTHQFGVAA